MLTGCVPQPLCDRHKRATAVLTVAGGPSHRRSREVMRPWGAQDPPSQVSHGSVSHMHGDKRGAADAPSDTAEPGGPGQASEELGPQPRVGAVGDVGAQERRGYAAVESPSLRRCNDTGGAGLRGRVRPGGGGVCAVMAATRGSEGGVWRGRRGGRGARPHMEQRPRPHCARGPGGGTPVCS